MKYLVAVPLDDEASVVMEIDDSTEGSGIVRSARPGELVATATKSFDAALGELQPMVQKIITRLRELAEAPTDVKVEFGLKMTVGSGLIVAFGSGEANFRVSLRWSRE